MSRRASLVVTVVFLAVVIAAMWWWHRRQDNGEAAGAATDRVLSQAMETLDGGSRSLGDWSGQTRLVNFWATWCAPCRAEMPLFQAAHERLADKRFQVIGIALDRKEAVARFGSELGITYPLLIVNTETGMRMMHELGNAAGVVPHSVLLAPDGTILDQHLGAYDESQLDALLDEHVR